MYTKYTRYTKELLEQHVPNVESYAALARALGKEPVGGTCTNLKARCDALEIDTSHFTGQGHNKGKQALARLGPTEILKRRSPGMGRRKAAQVRRALLEIGREYKCEQCGIGEWNDKPLTLEIDHIDGDFLNNLPDNLRFLCPNCHTQTPTYSNKRVHGAKQ